MLKGVGRSPLNVASAWPWTVGPLKEMEEKDNLKEECYTKLHLSKKIKLIKEPNS